MVISIVIAIRNALNVESRFLKSGIVMATKTSKYAPVICSKCGRLIHSFEDGCPCQNKLGVWEDE